VKLSVIVLFSCNSDSDRLLYFSKIPYENCWDVSLPRKIKRQLAYQ
jgi:hypothetical protein